MQGTLCAPRLAGAWLAGIAALISATVMTCSTAHAEADGPDFYRVTGVGEGSVLNVRSGPGTGYPAIGSLPFDADGIRNLGCEGSLAFAEWQNASPEEREAARKRRWCRIEHGGTAGWAAGWHLAEGSPPDATAGITPPDLVVVHWRLVFAPTGAAVGDAWIEFAADGAVHGKLGCNSFRGSAEVTADEIRAASPATTRMLCSDPGIDRQERAMAAVLSAPVRWQVTDGQLALVSADRTQELQFSSD
ncbi:MAG: META domain-containing protein [Geminicoccaceae bacterium]